MEIARFHDHRLATRVWEMAYRDPLIAVERWTSDDRRLYRLCFRRLGREFTKTLERNARREGIQRGDTEIPVAGQFKVLFEALGEAIWVEVTGGDDCQGVGFLHATPRSECTGLRWGDEIEFAGGSDRRRPRFVRRTGRRIEHCECPYCRPLRP